MRRAVILAAVLATAVGLTPAHAANQTVTSVNFEYRPDPVRVTVGDTLELRNLDREGHTVTHAVAPEDRRFASEVVAGGATGPVDGVADLRAGSYPVTCVVHPYMKTTLEVRPR